MHDLVAGLDTVGWASKAKHKYQVASYFLREAESSFDAPVRLVYLSPHPVPLLESIPSSIAIVFDELLDLELRSQPTAWRLFRDHLLAPVVGR